MRQLEIRNSSSPTYGGNNEHSASTCFETASPSISIQPPDKIHIPEVMIRLPELWPRIPKPSPLDAPQKKLTLFALQLAVIEKTASFLGQLAFIWATVVLLGGFASTLKPIDFWLVTIILVAEGARLFTRRSELEWHHLSTRTLPAATSPSHIQSHLSIRGWTIHALMRLRSFLSRLSHRLCLLALSQLEDLLGPTLAAVLNGCFFVSEKILDFLRTLQVFVAAVCAALSLMGLVQRPVEHGENAEINEKSALTLFYSLAFAEAMLSILTNHDGTVKIELEKLIKQVDEECELGSIGLVSLRRFFYDAFSKCIYGSTLDGLKMDLVSYAEELLHSDSPDEQIIGATILQRFVENMRFAGDTLRKIGSSTSVIERLIEMLNWEDPAEKDIRYAASVIISKLASRKQNALRVAAIPGAMESIASLLHTGGGMTDERPYEASPRALMVNKEDYDFSTFNLLGLLILKRLAWDHENCWKIGNAQDLLARIIELTSSGEVLLYDANAPMSRIKTVRRALQVVKILVGTTGKMGKTLRKDISKIVYLLSYIRELLQYGERHLKLQVLGVEILTSLGLNEEAREKIGATGSMMRLILAVFFRPMLTEEVGTVCNKAGEALAMLILESRRNCERMLKEDGDVVKKLVRVLVYPERRLNVAMILRSLCAYSAPEQSSRLQIVAEAMPTVLNTIMEENDEEEKLLEVSVGLAQQILNFMNPQVIANKFEIAGINDESFVGKLVGILRRYEYPESKVPRMRRFVIKLAITLMKHDRKYIELFRDLRMEQVLVHTVETTSELECFNIFSGSQGLGRPEEMISSLVDTALELLGRDDGQASAGGTV